MAVLSRFERMKNYQKITLCLGIIAMIIVFIIMILNRTHLMHIPGASFIFRGSRLIMLVSFAVYIFEESKILACILAILGLMFFFF